jgi:hypothetical protein
LDPWGREAPETQRLEFCRLEGSRVTLQHEEEVKGDRGCKEEEEEKEEEKSGCRRRSRVEDRLDPAPCPVPPPSPLSAHRRVSLEVSLVKRLVVGRDRPEGKGAASWASVGEAGGPFCTPPPPPPPARRSRTWPPWKVLRMVEPRARRLLSPDGGARL